MFPQVYNKIFKDVSRTFYDPFLVFSRTYLDFFQACKALLNIDEPKVKYR